ncbi:MAG: hypothetical protein GOU97_01625 [Nanoarchaeota archaeon]|nr:hypothetical protein [Nanoarchaeota archaeon]
MRVKITAPLSETAGYNLTGPEHLKRFLTQTTKKSLEETLIKIDDTRNIYFNKSFIIPPSEWTTFICAQDNNQVWGSEKLEKSVKNFLTSYPLDHVRFEDDLFEIDFIPADDGFSAKASASYVSSYGTLLKEEELLNKVCYWRSGLESLGFQEVEIVDHGSLIELKDVKNRFSEDLPDFLSKRFLGFGRNRPNSELFEFYLRSEENCLKTNQEYSTFEGLMNNSDFAVDFLGEFSTEPQKVWHEFKEHSRIKSKALSTLGTILFPVIVLDMLTYDWRQGVKKKIHGKYWGMRNKFYRTVKKDEMRAKEEIRELERTLEEKIVSLGLDGRNVISSKERLQS